MLKILGTSRHLACLSRKAYSTSTQSLLGKLRKQTGFPIKNCKKALEMNNNDLKMAKTWLNEEAQKEGWAKATQMQSRSTTQGLIGLQVKNQTAALVEVACETDFVSKNTIFQDLVKMVTLACYSKESQSSPTEKDPILEHDLKTTELISLLVDKKSLGDHAALAIAQLGENIVIRRGLQLQAAPDVFLAASVHPAVSQEDGPQTGNYGAAVALKPLCSLEKIKDIKNIGQQLCMHIIGMKPKLIGQEALAAEAVEKHSVRASAEGGGEFEVEFDDGPEEDALLCQPFVFEPEVTVADFLRNSNLKIIQFVRFEKGEILDTKDT